MSQSTPVHLVLALVLTTASTAHADPGYYLVSAYDRAGMFTADLRYWTVKPDRKTEIVWPEVGLSYGVNSRWTTGVLASYVGRHNSTVKPSTLNWRNQLLLTQGEWPVDVALHLDLIHSKQPYFKNAIEWGPVLQTDIGRIQLNANLFFERRYGALWPAPTQMKYQWQAKHRWRSDWHWGAQGFGELGPWNDWLPAAQQSHRAGPALFGHWALQGKEELDLSAAYLVGKTNATPGHMFSARLAYSF